MRDNIIGGALTETSFLILLALYTPTHGYSVAQFIERETNDRVLLGAGTLYGAIGTLEKKKWIEPVSVEVGTNRKVYVITELGRQIAEKEFKRINEISILALKVMTGGIYDIGK